MAGTTLRTELPRNEVVIVPERRYSTLLHVPRHANFFNDLDETADVSVQYLPIIQGVNGNGQTDGIGQGAGALPLACRGWWGCGDSADTARGHGPGSREWGRRPTPQPIWSRPGG